MSRVSSGSKGEGPAVEKAAEKGAGATRKEGVKLAAADRYYIVADLVDKIELAGGPKERSNPIASIKFEIDTQTRGEFHFIIYWAETNVACFWSRACSE